MYHYAINMGCMFGFIKNHQGMVEVSNRIFETLLYNLFLVSSNMRQHRIYGEALKDKNQFIKDGYLDDYGLDKGYLLSFNFNKNKKTGTKEIDCSKKQILEVVV